MNLDPYQDRFKAAVLKHIKEMDPIEWSRLRSMAANRRRWIPGMGHTFDMISPAEELVDDWVMEDSISVREVLVFSDRSIEIDLIDGLPIYYVQRRGIYIWGQQIDSRQTLSFWITTPAYPPGW